MLKHLRMRRKQLISLLQCHEVHQQWTYQFQPNHKVLHQLRRGSDILEHPLQTVGKQIIELAAASLP